MKKPTIEDLERVLPSYRELPDLLTPDQASAVTGMKPETLARDRAARQRWPFTKIGKRIVRYPKQALAVYLFQNLRGGGE